MTKLILKKKIKYSRKVRSCFKDLNTYSIKSDFTGVIASCSEIIRLDPTIAVAFYTRGFAYSQIGNYRQAIIDCTKAIELNPDDAMGYNNRGHAYLFLGQYHQAISDLSCAIRKGFSNNPIGYVSAWLDRAIAYGSIGDNEKSQADFKVALANSSHEQRIRIEKALNTDLYAGDAALLRSLSEMCKIDSLFATEDKANFCIYKIDDQDTGVREAALRAYSIICESNSHYATSEGIFPVIRRLSDSDGNVRERACNTFKILCQINPFLITDKISESIINNFYENNKHIREISLDAFELICRFNISSITKDIEALIAQMQNESDQGISQIANKAARILKNHTNRQPK